jgi:hypothetical protein
VTDDDGIGGPAGELLRASLDHAKRELGVAVSGGGLQWVDQEWRGRHLTIRVATYGVQAPTTGYRFVVLRLSTTARLGRWTDQPMRSDGGWEGVGLEITGDPVLGADLTAFARSREAVLQVRDDAVLWQLRASRLDEATLTEGARLLERAAAYAETHDAELTQRLGRAPGVTGWRRFETAYVVLVLGLLVVVLGGLIVLSVV